MKMVIAFVQPFMAPKVVHALHQVAGLSGATFTEGRGFGRGRAQGGTSAAEEELLGTLPKVRVEAMIPDAIEDLVVQAIKVAAHTGNPGDGKVYVAPLERAVRISSGEEGQTAI